MKKLSSIQRRSLRQVGSGTSLTLGRIVPYPLKPLSSIKELSREAKVRLKFLEFSQDHSVSLTSRHFGISRSTFYRWRRRYNPKNLQSLEDRPKTPKRVRTPQWGYEQLERVRTLREEYPFWGKEKLALLLKQEGYSLSPSTVGRILTYLKRRNLLREPVKKLKVRNSLRKRIYATRKPGDYQVELPGDLLQIDTLDLRFNTGNTFKGFTALDTLSRYGFAEVYPKATSLSAREFLEQMIRGSPFPIRAVQTDGGSEFYGEFEIACKELGIKFFSLPPRSPKLNGKVERMNRTLREEFWAFYEDEDNLEEMRAALRKWTSEVYNGKRPHQGLGYLTPAQYLLSFKKGESVSHVVN